MLLNNKYIFAPFWNYHNGLEGYADWQERLSALRSDYQVRGASAVTTSLADLADIARLADGIAVTCLNPGNIGTITVERGVVSAHAHENREMIPPRDLVAIVKCVIGLSNASCVKEIDVMAMTDRV